MKVIDNMPSPIQNQVALQYTDVNEALASMLEQIQQGIPWGKDELKNFALVFLDALKLPGRQSPETTKHIELAFDYLMCDSEHLALHRLILSRHSSGSTWILSSVAKAFGARLVQLAEGHEAPSTSILIALLLLRTYLPKSQVLERLPHWHQQRISAFNAEEALLLYNTTFDRRCFMQNVLELRAELNKLDWIQQWRDHGAKKLQIFLYHWPAEGDTSKLEPLFELISSEIRTQENNPALTDIFDILSRIIRDSNNGIDQDPSADLHRNGKRLWAVIQQYGLRPVGMGGRRPRIAICVSGQLRGYLPALASWRKHLLPGLEATFYIHTWKQTGRSGTEPYRRFLPFDGKHFLQCYREQCLKMGHGIFVRHYPHLFKELSESSEITEAHLATLYETNQVVVEDETGPEFVGWSNSRKMHYKIDRAQQLAEKSGQEYDMILRIRPDKAMRLMLGTWDSMGDLVRGGARILADMAMGVHYGNLMIGDQVALGTPDSMRIYSATHADALELERRGRIEVNAFLKGHVSLARQCFLNGVSVGKFPAKFGGLLGAAPLSPKEIQLCLAKDAEGRSDPIDRILMEAVAKDLAAH